MRALESSGSRTAGQLGWKPKLVQAVILCVLCVLCVEYTALLDRDPGLVVIHLAGRLEEAPDDA